MKETPLVIIEGLAAVGKIKRFWLEDCDTPLRKKIYAETVEGETIHTPCIDHRAIKKAIIALSEYQKLSKLIVE